MSDDRVSEAMRLAHIAMHYSHGSTLLEPAIHALEKYLTSQFQQTKAARDVLFERDRQISAEGWSAEHDDAHGNCSLARAAAAYALVGSSDGRVIGDEMEPSIVTRIWPWDDEWWKPSGVRRRNLIKAGALILAEIERLDRVTEKVKS